MKKLFTLVALLACFLGAKAEWVDDYSIDYSTKSNFPFYVMGYVPEWVDGVMTDYGANYRYATQDVLDNGDTNGNGKLTAEESIVGTAMAGSAEYQKVTGAGPYWHQYFIADGIPTELDGSYKVVAMVKASEEVTIDVNMGWSWSADPAKASVKIGTEWAEVEWSYSGIGGTSCNLVAQPASSTATIEWKWVKVSHNAKPQAVTIWQEWLTDDGKSILPDVEHTNKYMGDAETPWGELANVKFNDQTQNNLICAWTKERAKLMNDDGGWDPYPAPIEVDPDDAKNHVFVVHGQEAITEGDPAAWDNQFWIQSPKSWKSGEQVKISFRYKASKEVTVATQCHKQNPSDYLIWHAIGDIAFTKEWQTYSAITTVGDDMDGMWSVAFQLNQNDKAAIDFYFDNLSWQSMKLEEGFFVAGSNSQAGLDYDFANAIPFEYDAELDLYTATIGEVGNKESYVSEIMISTVRGNDAAFKANTLKLESPVTSDEDAWNNYTPGSLAKTKLPMAGVWSIYLDANYKAMVFVCLEGEEIVYANIVTNNTEIVVNGVEREDLIDTKDNEGKITVREDQDDPAGENVGGDGHNGQSWDNQFWFKANRTLAKGEATVLKFKYKANKAANTTTQCHGNPGGYMHWAAIGDVTFGTEWQEFSKDFTVPNEADGMQTIAFNMAEIKEACDYEITEVQWYLKGDENAEGKTSENLINATGTDNFWVKIGAGTSPYQYTGATGISTVASKKNVGSAVIYNLAGQRVSNGFKGIVVKDGKKYVK